MPLTALVVTAHLILLSLFASLGQFAAAFAENVTPAEHSEIERDAALGCAMLGPRDRVGDLRVCWRWVVAAIALVAECALGLVVLDRWLETSVHSNGWVYAIAAVLILTGLVALARTCD